jgi:ubiquinone/menaquinone biosynthesis C-methylase UbiE
MTEEDHRALLRDGVVPGTWADLGAGTGAFTAALAALLGQSGRIHAVDRDTGSLRELSRSLAARFPGMAVETTAADFAADLDLPPLDGICMANSLHFQPDPCAVLRRARRWLKPGGRIVLVEYDIERGNRWVPHPVPWSRLAEGAGCARLAEPRLLATCPSRWHGRVYSALLGARSD